MDMRIYESPLGQVQKLTELNIWTMVVRYCIFEGQ